MHNFRATIPIKLNAADDFLSKGRGIFDPVSRIFFRFSVSLFCCLVMMKTQNSFLSKKLLVDANETSLVTSVFAVNEN